jgi:outer membrane protein TolC
VTVGYPIGTSDAEASLARARLERQQSETRLRNMELQVATEVRNVGRRVSTNLKRVDATRAARQFAEQRLQAEERKFGVGMSTSFLVFQAQRDLSQARNSEVRAILDYIQSLVDFDAVQQVPVGGGIAAP